MGEETIKEVTEQITQVRLDIRELMTELRSLKDLQQRVEETAKTAEAALIASANNGNRVKEIEADYKWAFRTALVSLIGVCVNLFLTYNAGGQ